MKIAIIPARGGSQRIPRKNIKSFCGKPMIAWSITVAKESGLFDLVIVSTDDAEIAEVARAWGAQTPFLRPPELSNNFAQTKEVIAHATRWILNQGLAPDAICCIYPTAPFIQKADLKNALVELESGNYEFAFAVTEFSSPIFRALKKTAEGAVEMFFPEHFATRSQDLPKAFHDSGQFYWGRPEAWLNANNIFSSASVSVVIPSSRSQDIDSQEDWEFAEMLYQISNK